MTLFPLPLKEEPQDPIYGLFADFCRCEKKEKLNLAIGIIPDPSCPQRPWLLSSTQEACTRITASQTLNFSYSPLLGNEKLRSSVAKTLGLPQHFASIQSVGGTGAIRTLAELYKRHGVESVAFGTPSWPNHANIFSRLQFSLSTWNWSSDHGTIDMDSFQRFVQAHRGEEPLLFIFQLSCHNPTGIDPSLKEWTVIFDTIEKNLPKAHILFDIAYLGLAGRSLEEELAPLQALLKHNISFSVAFSCAKSLGLYSERVGLAYFICQSDQIKAIESHMASIQRAAYSSPPKLGALIAELILDPNSSLVETWKKEITALGKKLFEARNNLSLLLSKAGLPVSENLLFGHGLFSLLSYLTPETIAHLRNDHAIFLTEDGRINIACLLDSVIQEYFVAHIKKVLTP